MASCVYAEGPRTRYTIEMLLHGCVFFFLLPTFFFRLSFTQLVVHNYIGLDSDRTINTEPIPYTYIDTHETKTTHVAVE